MKNTNTYTRHLLIRPAALCCAVLLLVSGLSSCSIDRTTDYDPGAPVTFRPLMDGMTRAVAVTSGNYETELPSLTVHALRVGSGSNGADEIFFVDDFSFKGNIKEGGDTPYYESDVPYYWPKDDRRIYFYVYNTALGGTPAINSTANDASKITGVTVPADAKLQEDMLVTRTYGSGQTNGAQGWNVTNGVEVRLRHALAQIKVQARSSNPNMQVKVVGVKLGGISMTADFKIPNTAEQSSLTGTIVRDRWENWNTTKEACIYKHVDEVTAVQPALGSAVQGTLLTSTASDLLGGEGFMVIPQQVTTGAYIAVLCRIYQKTGFTQTGQELMQLFPNPGTGGGDKNKYSFTSVDIAPDWEPGKTYTYLLDFFTSSGGAGVYPPDQDDPTGGSDPGINDSNGTPGESILGGKLRLTVTVDNWGTGSSENINMQ